MRKINVIKNAIFGYVVGDALGLPLNEKTREELVNKPIYDMISNDNYNLPEGIWSNNTSLLLATMDSISSSNDIDYNDMADRYCSWINNNYYTPTFQIINLNIDVKESLRKYWDEKIDAYNCGLESNYKSDALIRMLPICIYTNNYEYTDFELLAVVTKATAITNKNEESIMASYLYCKFLNLILNGNSILNSYKLLQNYNYASHFHDETVDKFNRILKGEILNLKLKDITSEDNVISILEAFFYVLLNTKTFEESLALSVNLGEISSILGALTGSVAGIIYTRKEIPDKWFKSIKNIRYVKKLIKIFNRTL